MHFSFVVRNYHPQDFTTYVEFSLKYNRPDAASGTNSLGALTQRLGRPNYRPSENLFLADANGATIGYIDVVPELGIRRVVLDYLIHPAYSPGPIATELFAHALGRARELGAKMAHMNISSTGLDRAELLSSLGFREVRRYYELKLDLSEINLKVADQSNSTCRRLSLGEEESLAQIQNCCFAGSWGYNPNTTDEIVWWMNYRGSSPDDIILAIDESNLVGYCWTGITYGRGLSADRSNGHIYMLGVAPYYRKRGIGRKLLIEGLLHLRNKGQKIIDIVVDGQKTIAVVLYRSIGFQFSGSSLWYERIIEQA